MSRFSDESFRYVLYAAKIFVAQLNWHRPRGHKLSIRMLNRKQEDELVDWYWDLRKKLGLKNYELKSYREGYHEEES